MRRREHSSTCNFLFPLIRFACASAPTPTPTHALVRVKVVREASVVLLDYEARSLLHGLRANATHVGGVGAGARRKSKRGREKREARAGRRGTSKRVGVKRKMEVFQHGAEA